MRLSNESPGQTAATRRDLRSVSEMQMPMSFPRRRPTMARRRDLAGPWAAATAQAPWTARPAYGDGTLGPAPLKDVVAWKQHRFRRWLAIDEFLYFDVRSGDGQDGRHDDRAPSRPPAARRRKPGPPCCPSGRPAPEESRREASGCCPASPAAPTDRCFVRSPFIDFCRPPGATAVTVGLAMLGN